MLKHHMIMEEDLEDLVQEARKQIPFHTEYWKEFSAADPAEIILKDLSSLSWLQQETLKKIPEAVQEKLLNIAGFQKEGTKSARVLLEASGIKEDFCFPSGQRFQMEDLCFETNKDVKIRKSRITGIFTKFEDTIWDHSFLLEKDYPSGSALFTENPQSGMELYLVMDGMAEAGEDLIFYVQLTEDHSRNPFEGKSCFAQIQWQIYTGNGFADIRCKDMTGCFTMPGELVFRIPKEKAALYQELPQKGYVLRGILNQAEYDFFPKISGISGFLFEVWQKETKAVCHTYGGKKQKIALYRNVMEKGAVQIFGKEDQQEGYYLYKEAVSGKEKGRFYTIEKTEDDRFLIVFDPETFGYAPSNFVNAVKVVTYQDETGGKCQLGTVYGYDHQKIKLPDRNIVKESFSLIAQKEEKSGEYSYHFIRPYSRKKDEFYYTLSETEGVLEILDAGDFINSRIFLGGCAVSEGAVGNIRENCTFKPKGYLGSTVFTNPSPGRGGCHTETITDIRQRLKEDLSKTYIAVNASDYETLVKQTPQLCIDKVKAVKDETNNQVLIAVKPISHDSFPKLSRIYEQAIQKHLEKSRLVTVNIRLKQPVYEPVDVNAIVYVKSHYEGCQKKLEDVIRKQLDYISTSKNFGERFCFDDLFKEMEAQEYVKFIYDLSVSLTGHGHALQTGLDIQPAYDCLLYPGKITIELRKGVQGGMYDRIS